jgi:hypothetical protein
MVVRKPRYSKEKFARLAHELYESQVRSQRFWLQLGRSDHRKWHKSGKHNLFEHQVKLRGCRNCGVY